MTQLLLNREIKLSINSSSQKATKQPNSSNTCESLLRKDPFNTANFAHKLTDLWTGDVQEWRIFYASFLCYTVTKIEGPYHSIPFLKLHPTLSYFQGQAKEKWQKKFILILGCFWWWTKWTMEQICIIFFFRITSYHWIPYCSGVNSSFGLTFYKF